jgi:hypothetical protein
MGGMVLTTRDKKSVCMCVCEGEAGDQNKDAKERGVRERARNGEDGNDDEGEEERLYACEGETGDQNKDANPKGVRERASSCSSNRRKREGNPDDLKLRI